MSNASTARRPSAAARSHRDPLRDVTRGRTPCVVGETADGYEVLLGRADLEACKGDPPCLETALRRVIEGGA